MKAARRTPLLPLLAVGFALVLAAETHAAGPQGLWVDVQAAQARGDHATAFRLLAALADKGDADAQYDLAVLYQVGEDTPQDYLQAYKWYTIAIARFTPPEQSMRDRAVKNRDRVAGAMTPAEIAEAQRLAREWRPR